MTRPSQSVIVGVDVGGSKTHIRLEDARSGALLLDQTATSTHWASLSDQERATTLRDYVVATVGDLHVAALVAGVHGNDSPAQHAILSAPLLDAYTQVDVLNDSHLVILAEGLHSGTGIIAGTGSSATAVGRDRRVMTVGGWGWVLGDEGGGAGLVREAAREVLDAYDREENDALTGMLLDALNIRHPHSLTHCLGSTEPRLWAQVAPVIFAADLAGSPRARRAIARNVAVMVEMIALLGRRGGDVTTIVCAGSVFRHQPRLVEEFRAGIADKSAQTDRVVLLSDAPVAGALNLARERAGSKRVLEEFS